MASFLPLRLLGNIDGVFSVFDPRAYNVTNYDILSYTWGDEVKPAYDCGIPGVNWTVKINRAKLNDIQRFMAHSGVRYLWVDCVCINQNDEHEKAVEMARMYEYYKTADTCHILVDMPEVWDPQGIVDDLKFVDHVVAHMQGAALASEAQGLTQNVLKRLAAWAESPWSFDIHPTAVRSAGIELGLLNCYSTCIDHVKSLFDNAYFRRVWTFQEMILGKNITMWGISPESVSCIGALNTWVDLATDSCDKAIKLLGWIEKCRYLNTASVNAILRVISEDAVSLTALQTQVKGISSARTDVINGGPLWWCENYKGVSNIFSAVSIRERECYKPPDIFRGLLGLFSGLFGPDEVERDLSGDDMGAISFAFFKQLSIKTGLAWTKLAVSSTERGEEWNWIPVVENDKRIMTTDCFAGVTILGRLKPKGRAKAAAITGLEGAPKKFMKIRLHEGNGDFQFTFKGCNCGKKIKTGMFKREKIPLNDQPRDIVKDETGRVLVQCATVLGAIMDPAGEDIAAYRRRLLYKLQPHWNYSDPNAKPIDWADRSVSGTFWEKPDILGFRAHNISMNYTLRDITGCESRLANGSASTMLCEVSVNCGCTVVAPFSLIFEAISAVDGSSLGGTSAGLDNDGRIVLRDGLGLVQVGDVGKTFNMVAFGGDVNSHKQYSTACRNKKPHEAVYTEKPWPSGRALVREDFVHDVMDGMRDYGYVDTEGSGNLLICRRHPMDPYKIIGVCIDPWIPNTKGDVAVTIR